MWVRKIFINRNVALLFWGQVISQAGDSMSQIALIWLVLELTGSRSLTGLVASAAYFPFLLFALPAGTLADRFSRKKIMIISDGVRLCLVLSIPLLYALNLITIPLLAGITFISATFAAAFYPARDAVIPELTSRENFPHVNALIQSSWQLAVLLGPALAAILLPRTGIIHLFTTDSLTFLLSMLLLLLLRPRFRVPSPSSGSGAVKEMLEGVHYTFTNPRMRMVVLITALDNVILMGPAIVGIPIFVRDVLHLDATHYAWTEAALAGGIFIGAPIMALVGKKLHMGKLLLWGVILDGLTYLPLFWIRSFPLLLGAIFFHSIFIPMVTVSRTTLIQTYAPSHLQGRMFSIILMCVIGGTAVSSFLTGLIAEHVPMPTVYLGMALLAASTASPGFFSRALMKSR